MGKRRVPGTVKKVAFEVVGWLSTSGHQTVVDSSARKAASSGGHRSRVSIAGSALSSSADSRKGGRGRKSHRTSLT